MPFFHVTTPNFSIRWREDGYSTLSGLLHAGLKYRYAACRFIPRMLPVRATAQEVENLQLAKVFVGLL